MRFRLGVLLAALVVAVPSLAAGPSVEGNAYLVQNGTTGEVLLSWNAREQLPIASITKLMTVLVALEHVQLGDVVTVSRRAASIGESSIHLRRGERISVRDLIEAALIQSANDAALALAESAGGSVARFVELMNEKAAALGLDDTHFANPDGLDAPGHYSSARDVTRLARIAMKNRVIARIVAKQESSISGNRRLSTWNDLLSTFPGTFGVKTGHTAGAGWSEVAAARTHGVTIYATLLGSPARSVRNDDLTELLAWGLTRYRLVTLISKERVYAVARAPYGRAPLELRVPSEVRQIVRVDRSLVEQVVAPEAVSLPVRAGQQLGEVRVYRGRKLLVSRPLIATRSIAKPGFLGRAGWYAGQAAHNAWSWIT